MFVILSSQTWFATFHVYYSRNMSKKRLSTTRGKSWVLTHRFRRTLTWCWLKKGHLDLFVALCTGHRNPWYFQCFKHLQGGQNLLQQSEAMGLYYYCRGSFIKNKNGSHCVYDILPKGYNNIGTLCTVSSYITENSGNGTVMFIERKSYKKLKNI